jgi:hypothetical protein
MTYAILALLAIVAVSAASIVSTQFLGRLPLAILAQAQLHGRYAGLAAELANDARTPSAGIPLSAAVAGRLAA